MKSTPKYAVEQTVYIFDTWQILELEIKKVIQYESGKFRYEFTNYEFGVDEHRVYASIDEIIDLYFIKSIMDDILSVKEDIDIFINKNKKILAPKLETYSMLRSIISKLEEITDEYTDEDEPNT